MAILSEPKGRKDNPTALEDLDYDNFLSEAEATETVAINYEIPPPPPGITVTVHLDNKLKKTQDQKRNINLTTEYHHSLATRLTIPTMIYTMSSTLVAMRKQSSSTTQ